MNYGLWVHWNGTAGAWCGPGGRPVSWHRDAMAFGSIGAAHAYAAARGWPVSTSAVPPRTTAYAAELGAREVGRAPRPVAAMIADELRRGAAPEVATGRVVSDPLAAEETE